MAYERLCPQGHDKFVFGVDKLGACTECRRIRGKERYERIHGPKPQNCLTCGADMTKFVRRRVYCSAKCRPCTKKAEVEQRFTRYNITEEDRAILLEKQNGGCAICGILEKNVKRGLFVDHNHQTNKTRGLLCTRCNSLLAAIEDVNFRELALVYLEKHK